MRRLAVLLPLFWFPCLSSYPAVAVAGHVPGQVEASFLVNLFKFVRWSQDPPSLGTATICFLRPSVVQARLEGGLAAHETWTRLLHRTVIIRMLTSPDELSSETGAPACQILYLDAQTADQVWPFNVPSNILTVSNQKNFAYKGGMIQFLWDSTDTYRIAIHTGRVIESGLIVNGELGTLVDRVDNARFSP